LNSEVEVVYARIDVDNSGTISESQFVRAVQELGLEQSEAEVRRIFSQLATTDEGLPKTEFLKAVQRNTFLQTVVSAYVSPKASVAEDYDFRLPTYINHRHPHYVGEKADGTSSRAKYREDVHGPVYGSYAALRKELDYSWHTNYTCSRQRWQDTVITNVASSPLTADDKRPWLLWTCGPMGAGKGFAMNWLSRHGIVPMEKLVHIDPDYFKRVMPEWEEYCKFDSERAGTNCHKESGMLQELATELALRAGENTWVDGSLRDHDWYSGLFSSLRSRFPQYRLAIFYVHCSEEKVYERAARRAKVTGRVVPQDLLRQSISECRDAFRVLGPLADFVVVLNNDARAPVVESVEDRTGSFAAIHTRFATQSLSEFPNHFRGLTVIHDPMPPWAIPLECLQKLDPMAPVHVKMKDAFSAETLALIEEKIPDNLGSDWLSDLWLSFSPTFELNLDPLTREEIGTPKEATVAVWCYGANGPPGLGCSLKQERIIRAMNSARTASNPMSGISAFLARGGFIYMDSGMRFIAATAMSTAMANPQMLLTGQHGKLNFGLPITRFPHEIDRLRWMCNRYPDARAGGAVEYAWVLPEEFPHGPFGGFAFELSDGKKVFFPVVVST
jgi:hypothetical protein